MDGLLDSGALRLLPKCVCQRVPLFRRCLVEGACDCISLEECWSCPFERRVFDNVFQFCGRHGDEFGGIDVVGFSGVNLSGANCGADAASEERVSQLSDLVQGQRASVFGCDPCSAVLDLECSVLGEDVVWAGVEAASAGVAGGRGRCRGEECGQRNGGEADSQVELCAMGTVSDEGVVALHAESRQFGELLFHDGFAVHAAVEDGFVLLMWELQDGCAQSFQDILSCLVVVSVEGVWSDECGESVIGCRWQVFDWGIGVFFGCEGEDERGFRPRSSFEGLGEQFSSLVHVRE